MEQNTPNQPAQEQPNQLGIPAVLQSFGDQTAAAQVMGAAAQGGGAVMEIDPSSPPEQQAREREEAMRLGIPIVEGRGGAQRQPARTGPEDEEQGRGGAHPLLGVGGQEPSKAFKMPPPTPEVLRYFKDAGIAEPEKLLGQLPGLQTSLADLSRKSSEMEERIAGYESLSEDVQEIIEAELTGRDWRSDIASGIDFNKPFSKQNQRAMVEKFSKVRITDEDWDEYKDGDGDPRAKQRVESALEEARDRFMERVEARREAPAQRQARAKEVERKVRDSRNAAIDFLDGIPGSAAHKDRVAKSMTPKDILGFFFEKDMTTFRKDAGLNLWMLLDRDTLIAGATGDAHGQANDAAMKRMLSRMDERSPNRPRAGGGGSGGVTAEQLAKQRFAQLMR